MAWPGSFIAAFISNFSMFNLWSINIDEESELDSPDDSDEISSNSDESDPEPYPLVNRERYSPYPLVNRELYSLAQPEPYPLVNRERYGLAHTEPYSADDQHTVLVPTCFCGHIAKRRVSNTQGNRQRPFYNCRKPDFDEQCRYFEWEDDLLDQESRESSGTVCAECLQLRRRITAIEAARRDDWVSWERERLELIAEVTSVTYELDRIKKRFELANEADEMPPSDKLSISDEGVEGEVVKAIVQT